MEDKVVVRTLVIPVASPVNLDSLMESEVNVDSMLLACQEFAGTLETSSGYTVVRITIRSYPFSSTRTLDQSRHSQAKGIRRGSSLLFLTGVKKSKKKTKPQNNKVLRREASRTPKL